MRPLVNDHTVEASCGVVARLPLAPKGLLTGVLSLVLHQFVVGHQGHLTARPVALEAVHRRVGRLVDFNLSTVPLQTVSLDDAIVVAAEAAALPGTLVPDAALVWPGLFQRTGRLVRLAVESCSKNVLG